MTIPPPPAPPRDNTRKPREAAPLSTGPAREAPAGRRPVGVPRAGPAARLHHVGSRVRAGALYIVQRYLYFQMRRVRYLAAPLVSL